MTDILFGYEPYKNLYDSRAVLMSVTTRLTALPRPRLWWWSYSLEQLGSAWSGTIGAVNSPIGPLQLRTRFHRLHKVFPFRQRIARPERHQTECPRRRKWGMVLPKHQTRVLQNLPQPQQFRRTQVHLKLLKSLQPKIRRCNPFRM